MEKIVLDLNIIISGSLFDGNEAAVLELVRRGRYRAVISKQMVARLTTALNYPHLARYLHGRKPREILEKILRDFDIVGDVTESLPFKLDKDDSAVLLCATKEKAAYLVTGDKVLLAIAKHESVEVVNAVKFLQISL